MKQYISDVPQIRMGFDTIERNPSTPCADGSTPQSRLKEAATDLSLVLCVEGGVVASIIAMAAVIFTR